MKDGRLFHISDFQCDFLGNVTVFLRDFLFHQVHRGIKERRVYDTNEENCSCLSYFKSAKKICVHVTVS